MMPRVVYLLGPTGEAGVWSEDNGRTVRSIGDSRVYPVVGGLRDELTTWIEDHHIPEGRWTEAGLEALGRRRVEVLRRRQPSRSAEDTSGVASSRRDVSPAPAPAPAAAPVPAPAPARARPAWADIEASPLFAAARGSL